MSKKMLKRSLALGALMAFVITGSAMAADINDLDAYSHNHGGNLEKIGYDSITTSADVWAQGGHKIILDATNITVRGDGTYSDIGYYYGVCASGDEAQIKLTASETIDVTGFVWNEGSSKQDDTGVELNAKNIVIRDGMEEGAYVGGVVAYGENSKISFVADSSIEVEGGVGADGKNAEVKLTAQNAEKTATLSIGKPVEIYAENAKITLTGDNITVNGWIKTDKYDFHDEEGNLISVDAKNSEIILDGGNVEVKDNVEAKGTDSTISITGTETATINGNVMSCEGKSNIKIKSEKNVTIDGEVLAGGKGSNIELIAVNEEDTATLTVKEIIETDNDDTTITLTGDTVNVNSGIYANGSDSNIVVNGNHVTVNGNVTANGNGTNINLVSNDGNLNIYGTVEANATSEGTVIDLQGKKILVDASNGYGVRAISSYNTTGVSAVINIGTTDTENIDINNVKNGLDASYEGTSVNVLAKDLKIDGAEVAIYAANGSVSTGNYTDKNPNNNAKVTVNADTTTITNANCAIVAFSQGIVEINGNLYATADDVIAVRGEGVVNINAANDENKIIQLNGDIRYDYTNYKVDSSVNINLSNEKSSFTGSIYNTGEGETDGKVTGMKLGLSNGATWDVTGDSFVNELTGNGGNLVINDTEHNIDIDTNSNTALKVKASEALTDAIASGETTLEAVAQTVEIAEGNTTLTVETQETDIAGVSSLTYNAETGDAGAVVKQVSAKNDAISNAGMALKGHYRAHMNDMNKRMGELRMANGEAGVWTRMVRGESEYEGAKMQYNQYQLGYDEKLSVDKRWTVGAAVTFAEGDSNYGFGSTEDKSTAFAIYGSKLNDDGTFVDLIARYARLESDIDDVQSGKGDYSTNGMSVSAEFGKRIQQGKGLWIEPQVELTYGTIDGADLRLDGTNKDIHVDSMDSFIARVGFSMGKDIKQGNVYARASYLYDFDGETETSFSANGVQGDVVKEDFGGGWFEVGVGANINLSKATYIYADIEKTFGGEVDTNWQWNLGVRYSF